VHRTDEAPGPTPDDRQPEAPTEHADDRIRIHVETPRS
jgi:hypothetical protein